jgi:hypothetical protein
VDREVVRVDQGAREEEEDLAVREELLPEQEDHRAEGY